MKLSLTLSILLLFAGCEMDTDFKFSLDEPNIYLKCNCISSLVDPSHGWGECSGLDQIPIGISIDKEKKIMNLEGFGLMEVTESEAAFHYERREIVEEDYRTVTQGKLDKLTLILSYHTSFHDLKEEGIGYSSQSKKYQCEVVNPL